MKRCILIAVFMVITGCSSEVVQSEAVKWVSAGTLVSVAPDMESTRPAGRAKSAILGEAKLSRTRVETTEGVYIVGDKIGIAETGVSVRVGYDSSETPSYLFFGGQRYKIVR